MDPPTKPRQTMTETTTHYTTISLAEIMGHVEGMTEDALAPGAEPEAVIVEARGGTVEDIVDGYHRTAGYVAWAAERGIDPTTVTLRVLVVSEETDEDLVAMAAEPGPRQASALAALYEAAA